eukprot:8850657-Lingulodinium_polyedra.AAC.1
MNEVERYVKTSLTDFRKECSTGLDELNNTFREDLDLVVGIIRATEERMTKQAPDLIGRVETLERAPVHGQDSAAASSAANDLSQLQQDHAELRNKLEEVLE